MTSLLPAFLGCLLSTLAFSQDEVRHEESNSEFTIKVIRSEVLVTRKSDGAFRLIKKVLWGKDPGRRRLPSVMLDKTDSVLLLPKADYSHWLIDLNNYFDSKMTSFAITKIEGGARTEKGYDHTPLFFGLDRILTSQLLHGGAMNHQDQGCDFFMDLAEHTIIVKDPAHETLLTARTVDLDGSHEYAFRIQVDPKKHAALTEKYLNAK